MLTQVYILVPSSWAFIEGSEDAHQVHEDADIRVEVTNNLYGDTPFTLQTGECGEQGEYIQVICLKVSDLEKKRTVSDIRRLPQWTCKPDLSLWPTWPGVPL